MVGSLLRGNVRGPHRKYFRWGKLGGNPKEGGKQHLNVRRIVLYSEWGRSPEGEEGGCTPMSGDETLLNFIPHMYWSSSCFIRDKRGRISTPPKMLSVGTPDAAPAENQGFSPGDPDFQPHPEIRDFVTGTPIYPVPVVSQRVPVQGRRGHNTPMSGDATHYELDFMLIPPT